MLLSGVPAMRLMPSFHLSYPDARGVRIALAAGAISGLLVLAACSETDTTTPQAAPKAAPRGAVISSGFQGHGVAGSLAGTIEVCVDGTSPAGTYQFTNSGWSATNGTLISPPYPGTGRKLTGSADIDRTQYEITQESERGTTTFPTGGPGAATYTVVKGALGCVTVLNRGAPSTHYTTTDSDGFGPNGEDDWQGVRVATSSIPAGVIFDRVDCVADIGTYLPSNTAGTRTCDNTSNPSKVNANYDHGIRLIFVFKSQPVLAECVLGYPNTNGPVIDGIQRSNVDFNESEVLRGFALTGGGTQINAIYSDEHALTLGVRQNFTNNKGVDVTTNFTIATMTGNMNPTPNNKTAKVIGSPFVDVGSPLSTAAPFTPVDGYGRPLFPSLFLTDLTALGPNSTAGDWQQGGSPIPPSALYGTWKAVQITLDNTKNPPKVTQNQDTDPSSNGTNFGPGAPVGTYPAGLSAQGYTTDVVWNLSNATVPTTAATPVGYDASHAYRALFMVHDGDQNKTGGDVGQACVNIVPGT
jgi:hypothetical protein